MWSVTPLLVFHLFVDLFADLSPLIYFFAFIQEWWSDLWLNEGFASFMQYLFLDANYPEMNPWLLFANDVLASALDLDALKNSHSIEVNSLYHFSLYSTNMCQP